MKPVKLVKLVQYIPVEEEAGEPSHDMADRSREVEGVSDSILPAGGWVDAVD